MYDRMVPIYLNEHGEHHGNLDAPAETERPFYVADYYFQYSCIFHVCRFEEVLQRSGMLTFRDASAQERGQMLLFLRKRCNQSGIRGALELCFSSSETVWSSVRYDREEDNEERLVSDLAWMLGRGKLPGCVQWNNL